MLDRIRSLLTHPGTAPQDDSYLKREAEFRAFFDSASVGFAKVDFTTGKFSNANKAYLDIVGYTLDELRELTPHDITHPDDREEDIEHLEALAKGKSDSFAGEKRYIRKDGSVIWVQLNVSLVRDLHGKPFRTTSVVLDITERKKAVEALKESERRFHALSENLQEALRARDEFLSIASHELKTPLTTLSLQLQMFDRSLKALAGLSGPGTAQMPVERIERVITTCRVQSNRLADLVDELLDLTRIRSGKLKLEREKVDLNHLVAELINRFAMAGTTGGLIRLKRSEEAAIGYWDPLRVEQVVTNLLSNAIKYGEGMPIDVQIGVFHGEAVLTVQDQGMGIAPDMQRKVFERFERGVGPTQITGLGLGLYITKQIIEAHGGQISLRSELGQGSTFTVILPMEESEAAA